MRGIVSSAGYVPFHRLQRSAIAEMHGSGGGKGTRSVASFDEDTTTMGVAAARFALAPTDRRPETLWFSTASPAYLDKTNATAIHAALRLDASVLAMDAGGAIRSGVGALRSALEGSGDVLVVASDMRTGLPTSTDEAQGGDAAAAVLVGDDDLHATYLGGASATHEFLERWRTPGEVRSKTWEDRFGESMYVPLGEQAFGAALKAAELTPEDVDVVCVTGMHARSVGRLKRRLGVADEAIADDLASTVGVSGTAHPLLVLTSAIETTEPERTVVLLSLADGADALVFRTAGAERTARSVADQISGAVDVPYARFLSWRGMLTPEPPNRPEPARVSAPAAERAEDWKFAFTEGDRPLADTMGTIATFTVDRLAYSPSPPIVFAIVDFDGGGRFPLELTDVDPERLSVGDRVEMTFRRLSTADGIHNYFWKAKPVPATARREAPSKRDETTTARREAPSKRDETTTARRSRRTSGSR